MGRIGRTTAIRASGLRRAWGGDHPTREGDTRSNAELPNTNAKDLSRVGRVQLNPSLLPRLPSACLTPQRQTRLAICIGLSLPCYFSLPRLERRDGFLPWRPKAPVTNPPPCDASKAINCATTVRRRRGCSGGRMRGRTARSGPKESRRARAFRKKSYSGPHVGRWGGGGKSDDFKMEYTHELGARLSPLPSTSPTKWGGGVSASRERPVQPTEAIGKLGGGPAAAKPHAGGGDAQSTSPMPRGESPAMAGLRAGDRGQPPRFVRVKPNTRIWRDYCWSNDREGGEGAPNRQANQPGGL